MPDDPQDGEHPSPEPGPEHAPRPRWLAPLVLLVGLLFLMLLCIGLSVWGP
jgi:hypothetical protein